MLRDTIGLQWDRADTNLGEPGYRVPAPSPMAPSTVFGRDTGRYRTGTHSVVPDESRRAATDAHDRLQRSIDTGGFLAVNVEPSSLTRAEHALVAAFDVELVSAERLFVDALRAVAAERNIKWDNAIVATDTAGPDGPKWANLLTVARRAGDRVEHDLLGRRNVMLTRLSALARYGLLDAMLDRLRDRTTINVDRDQTLRTLWVLVPMIDPTAKPTVGTTPVPVITSNQWMTLPEPWLRNAHGTTAGAA